MALWVLNLWQPLVLQASIHTTQRPVGGEGGEGWGSLLLNLSILKTQVPKQRHALVLTPGAYFSRGLQGFARNVLGFVSTSGH